MYVRISISNTKLFDMNIYFTFQKQEWKHRKTLTKQYL